MERRARITLLFTLLALALTAPAAMASYGDEVLLDNPSLYWPLNETTGTVADDASPAASDGTYDAVTLGEAREYPGLVNAVNLGTGGKITGNVAGGVSTIELWTYVAANAKRDQVLAQIGDVRIGSDRRKKLYIESGTHRAGTKLSLPTGRWVLVDVRWNGGDNLVHFTVNAVTGTATKKVAAPAGLTTASGAVTVADGPAANDHFNGKVDELALYPVFLPDARVREHFKQTGAPLGITAPTISGTPVLGGTLTADTGAWQNPTSGALSYAFHWSVCDGNGCDDIVGATGETLALNDATWVGRTLQVEVTATNVNGSATQTSDETDVVTEPAPATSAPHNEALPVIFGIQPFVGRALTSTDGTWTGSPTPALSRQWQRCDAGEGSCVDMDGQTGSGYTPTSADIGSTLRLVVTAENSVGEVVVHSAVTDVVPDPSTTTDPGPVDGSGATTTTTTTGGAQNGTLPGQATSCLRFTAIPKRLNKKVKQLGRVRIGPVTGSKAGTGAVKLQVRLAKGKKLKSVTWTLDGKKLTTAKKRPYTVSLLPAKAGKAGTHVLRAKLTPKKGKSRTLKTYVLVKAC